MAKKAPEVAKTEAPPGKSEEPKEGDAAPAAPKKGGIGGIISGILPFVLSLPKKANPLKILKLPLKQKLMVGGGVLVALLAIGGAVMFLGGGAKDADVAAEGGAAKPVTNLPPVTATFYDMPDIIVNIQTADGTSAYLKLTVALELDQPDAKAAIEPVLPRIVDQFQTYLRELRIEDIRGSVGVMRLKEELLRRVNLAAAPIAVHDVLFKEMIVQ